MRGPSARRRGQSSRRGIAPYLFILPFYVVFIPFGAGAVIFAIGMGFLNWPVGGAPEFAGVQNFIDVATNNVFQRSLFNTVQMLIGFMLVLLPLALLMASILNRKRLRGRAIFQTAFFLPITVSLVAGALIFDLLLDGNFGFFNSVLHTIGLPGIPFLEDPVIAPWAVVLVRLWRVTGYYAVIFYAGMQTIPAELYEAAALDGAGRWHMFRYVTLPRLRPVTLFIVVASSVAAWELFAEPQVLTDGGPARATFTAVMYIYQTSFLKFDLGHGAAAAAILALCIFTTTLLVNRTIGRDQDE